MTKKDYIAIASVIKEAKEKTKTEVSAFHLLNYIIAELENIFVNDNPRFNAEKFLSAIYD